ncbi:MAG TPA: O-antigen ligase family protein [Solirubrobacteraceae bacterium]|jgi:O-antigen ligase|nr:O-antigen ligase family protein [Solirubrobacteraceae bacterium]
MELTASGTSAALTRPRRLVARLGTPAVAAWTLAFAVVAYLALSDGGYDTIVRSQVGVAVWWIVLLGALAGILPGRIGKAGWVAIGLLAAFALWTGLATGWSESAERSTIELGRVATYLGVLVLAIALQGRAGARHTINGLASAIGLVTALAVLSRLHPQWFPVDQHLAFLGQTSARKLSYPLNYWNALAAFAAIGVPLLLGVALGARTLLGQALAAAALPLSALCLYLTISRGGALALVVGIVVFLMFVPRRLDALGTLATAAAGSAILLAAASQRDALQDGSGTAATLHQGTQMIWLALIACGGVGLLQVAIGLASRHLRRPAWLAPSRRATLLRALALVAIIVVAALFAGAPGYVDDRWQEFKSPSGTVAAGSQDNVFSRLQGADGNGRYQYWQAALHAEQTDPLKGIGPGTFEFWWARHGTDGGFVRDAHTLYFQTLAETGIVGFALLIGMLAFLLGAAVVRALRAPPGTRLWIAAAVGGLAAFMTSAAFEWVWQMGAIACAVMVLGAVILAGRDEADVPAPGAAAPEHSAWSRSPVASRVLVGVLAVAALGAVAVPMAGALATRASQDAAAQGRLAVALQDSRTAQRVQPYAATPHLQQALVLEQAGSLSAAAVAARAATRDEPTNWRTWFTLARIDARQGKEIAAVQSLRKARALNPGSPLLARTR